MPRHQKTRTAIQFNKPVHTGPLVLKNLKIRSSRGLFSRNMFLLVHSSLKPTNSMEYEHNWFGSASERIARNFNKPVHTGPLAFKNQKIRSYTGCIRFTLIYDQVCCEKQMLERFHNSFGSRYGTWSSNGTYSWWSILWFMSFLHL